jgi:hypothetical protein
MKIRTLGTLLVAFAGVASIIGSPQPPIVPDQTTDQAASQSVSASAYIYVGGGAGVRCEGSVRWEAARSGAQTVVATVPFGATDYTFNQGNFTYCKSGHFFGFLSPGVWAISANGFKCGDVIVKSGKATNVTLYTYPAKCDVL